MELSRFFMVLLLLHTAQMGCSSGNRFDIMEDPSESVFDVVAYGAVGDGQNDDSQAFMKAWTEMCGATTPSPTLLVPSGMTFLLNPVIFKGPCNSPNPHVQVLGNIIAPNKVEAWSGSDNNTWLGFAHVNGLIMDGSGQIDGQGSVWWSRPCEELDDISSANSCGRPTALRFGSCNNLLLRGLRHLNSPRNHISIMGCTAVTFSDISITAPEDSPNTDGIDISSSTNIQIRDSFIGTGDDCIAINDGCSFINITNVACGPGHGISVGSLGAHGRHETVEEVHVQDCNFTRTMNAARIKSWQGGSGYARKISFSNIRLVEVRNPIIIDQFYCPSHQGCQNYTSAVEVSDVTYDGIHGTSESLEAINLSCSQSVGCSNILMKEINITAAPDKLGKSTFSYCFNAHGKSEATLPAVPCLST